MDEHAVCVLPGQRLDDDKQIAFASLYGPLEVSPPVHSKDGGPAANFRIQNRHIFDVSNLDEQGRILPLDDQRRAYRQGNELWHTDSSFRQKSATWSMLHARVIPPDGADTQFADTRAAYDALPEATKAKLEGLIAEHSIWHSRAQYGGYTPTEEEIKARPPARHPLVRRHPGLGPQGALHRLARLPHHRLAGRGRPRAAPRAAGARDAAALRLCPQVAARRPGDLGQPLHPAPRHAVRVEHARPRHAAQHGHRRPLCRSDGELRGI